MTWRLASLGIFACAVAASSARAEDTVPRALPDRIEDVPSTKVDPFPAFDNFAWRAFIALNWPARADRRGEPDRAKALDDPGPRVWETFKSRWEAFPPEGVPTAGWDDFSQANPCGASVDSRERVVAAFEPYAEFNQAGFEPGKLDGTLVAQNRTYVRYEVRLNKTEFDAIVANGWRSFERAPTTAAPAHVPEGAVAVKAAWRVLTSADSATRARYYVVSGAEVVDVAASRAASRIVCSRQDLALVGFHVAIKTHYRPQWIWSTFEHVDNVPAIGEGEAREPDARAVGAPYSFNDPSGPQSDVSPGKTAPTARPVSADHPPEENPTPVQVVRKHPIRPQTMALNRLYWALPEVAARPGPITC